jgi:hypothetical protein
VGERQPERSLSERMAELGRRSGEVRRQRRDAETQADVPMPDDMVTWTDERLVQLAANDRNPAAAVAALKELRNRLAPPTLDIGTAEPRGVLLWELLNRHADHRAEAVSALARAIEAGYDVDAIVTAAREQQASGEAAITAWSTSQPSNGETGVGVVAYPPFDSSALSAEDSRSRMVSSQNPGSGDPGLSFSEWSARRSFDGNGDGGRS